MAKDPNLNSYIGNVTFLVGNFEAHSGSALHIRSQLEKLHWECNFSSWEFGGSFWFDIAKGSQLEKLHWECNFSSWEFWDSFRFRIAKGIPTRKVTLGM
jgi:hypothetical protein